jgi:2',3'-cyclic-nucleotide 2'-phosphodiesterase (5'-nucleotidase family)
VSNATGVTVPITMGWDKVIGRAEFDYETGKMTANIDMKLVKILAEGLGENLIAIGFYAKGANPAMTKVHEEIQEYNKEPND